MPLSRKRMLSIYCAIFKKVRRVAVRATCLAFSASGLNRSSIRSQHGRHAGIFKLNSEKRISASPVMRKRMAKSLMSLEID